MYAWSLRHRVFSIGLILLLCLNAFLATTFGGSGFPADKQGHLYMTHSGCTFCNGPSVKRIDEWVLNADGTVQSGPMRLLDYTGTGKATLAGLVAGPDGLYFTDLYADSSTTAPTRGANVYRIRKLN